MKFAATAALALALLGAAACTEEDVFVLAPADPADASTIDADAVALLPASPVVLSYVDASALFKTSLAPSAAQFVSAVLPLNESAGFVASRDVTHVWSGLYALQGLDFCSIVQGNFDVEAVKRAVAARSIGALTESRYAGFPVYTTGGVGFTIVTRHTALTGTPIGMRRALDRLSRGKLDRVVPAWMVDLTKTPNVDFVLAADLRDDPAVEAASRQIPFLMGLERARVIGNFRSPGVNVAGALSYPDIGKATAAAGVVRGMNGAGTLGGWIVAAALGGTPPPLDVGQAQNDVGFVSRVDEGLARGLLSAAAIFARGARP